MLFLLLDRSAYHGRRRRHRSRPGADREAAACRRRRRGGSRHRHGCRSGRSGQLEPKALAFVKAHYPDNSLGALKGTPTVTRTSSAAGKPKSRFREAEIPTYFIKIGGIDKLTVAVNSQVLRQDNKLEVVMVLDNSGSMAGSKLHALKDAANTLVDILFGTDTVSDKVKVGLVPFTAAVNVNVPSNTPWLDSNKPIPALLNSLLFLPSLTSGFTVLGVMNGGIAANWRGCVRSRYNLLGLGDPLDTTDAPPDPLNPQTLFSAYFNPFRPGGLPQALGLYNGVSSDQQNVNCPVAKVQQLTDTKTAIGTAINAMTADGSTNIPEGLAWGWRLISPGEPFIQGAPYSDPVDDQGNHPADRWREQCRRQFFVLRPGKQSAARREPQWGAQYENDHRLQQYQGRQGWRYRGPGRADLYDRVQRQLADHRNADAELRHRRQQIFQHAVDGQLTAPSRPSRAASTSSG